MEKVLRNDEVGLLLFLAHDDDHAPPWPDARGYAGCADSFVETRDIFERRRCLGTLRLYVREHYPSPAFVLDELIDELNRYQMHWIEICDPAEACRIRIEESRTVWIAAGEPAWLTPEQELALQLRVGEDLWGVDDHTP